MEDQGLRRVRAQRGEEAMKRERNIWSTPYIRSPAVR